MYTQYKGWKQRRYFDTTTKKKGAAIRRYQEVDSGLDNDDDNDDAQPARRMEAEAVEAKSRSFRKSRIPVGVNACLRPLVRHAGGGTPEICFDIRSRRHLSFPPVQFVVIHFFRHGASHCDAGACT